jgi:hypothetical protein
MPYGMFIASPLAYVGLYVSFWRFLQRKSFLGVSWALSLCIWLLALVPFVVSLGGLFPIIVGAIYTPFLLLSTVVFAERMTRVVVWWAAATTAYFGFSS